MKDWSLAHPYLTFTLVLVALLETGAIVQMIVGLFKKPEPVTLNIKTDASVPQSSGLESDKSFN